MNLDTTKDAATKAVQTVSDTTTQVGVKAKEYTETAAAMATDYGTTATDTVIEATEAASSRVTEYGGIALATVSDTATMVIEQTKGFAERGYNRIKEFQLGDKNVGERAQATVDSVSEHIDVDQISDSMKKARHQMEGAVNTWMESFRPSTTEPEPKPKATPAKKPAAKKPATKASTAAKKPAATKKPTTKATTAKKTTAAKK